MRPLPTGTLTLLFSDIEGSTSLVKGLGERWGEALSAQRRLLRDAFQHHDGIELGTEGDSFFVVFASAQQALRAAVAGQRALAAHSWPHGAPVRVRMGLHTGEPQRHEDGYIGLDVHRAARIAATASGGQIVLSAATRALVHRDDPALRGSAVPDSAQGDSAVPGSAGRESDPRGSAVPGSAQRHPAPGDPDPDVRDRAPGDRAVSGSAARESVVAGSAARDLGLRDLGWHRLKDLPDPEHLFDVAIPGLPDRFPPLRSLGTRANLPGYATELIGRDTELAELVALVDDDDARLVTLTGPGGTGKTRLGVAAARELQRRCTWDTFFVALAPAADTDVMWSAIAEAVGAAADADETPDQRALRFVAGRTALLVLDNLEQIPDADVVVSDLLNASPDVRVLVTSRRPLHLVDEVQVPVTPLPVPRWDAGMSVAAAEQGAVALFVRRARMVKRDFRLTEHNLADVVALCRRLDGLPLAIELAAARSRLLTPKALVQRLDDRLAEPPPIGHRSERQKTLEATIRWSYDLLADADRQVFRALGVFASRFDLDALAQVAGTAERDPLDVVAHLIDVSLVESGEGADGEPVVWLLETIRRFARQALARSGEEPGVRLAHARWCLAAAQRIAADLHTPRQMSALDHMAAVEEDIRAALAWCLDAAGAHDERRQLGLALLEPMDKYWYRFGYLAEGRVWHDRALRLLNGDDVADSAGVLDALHGHGVLAVQQQELTVGTAALEGALAMAHRLGDRFRQAREANSLGIARREAGRIDDARVLFETSLELARALPDREREATALSNLVHVHVDTGNYAAAVTAAHRAIDADRAVGDPWGVAVNQCNLVVALLNAEGPQPAYEQLRAAAPGAVALGDLELTIEVIDAAAAVWAAFGDAERAGELLGVADHQRALAGIPRAAPDATHLARFLDPARAALPAGVWQRAVARGAQWSIGDAVALAVADNPARAGARP